MVERLLPKAPLCANCVHARRWIEDKGQDEGKDSEIVVCRLYSLLLSGAKEEKTEEDEKLIDPAITDAPKDYTLGWGDLMARPGNRASAYLTNNCVLVSYRDTCAYFNKNDPEKDFY
jgi:hypothetical protein